jgi:hypothetical protein
MIIFFNIVPLIMEFTLIPDVFCPTVPGIEFADSLVVDAHKSLFLPYGIGIVLIRDREHLRRLSRFSANFVPTEGSDAADSLLPAESSPELTKVDPMIRQTLNG